MTGHPSGESPDAPIPISDELVREFFAFAESECPFCRTNRWHRLAEDAPGENYSVPPFRPRRGPGGLEVVVLYCMKCGFVRLHAAHLIRARSAET